MTRPIQPEERERLLMLARVSSGYRRAMVSPEDLTAYESALQLAIETLRTLPDKLAEYGAMPADLARRIVQDALRQLGVMEEE